MICPFCEHNDDKVIDSRASEAGKVVRRRRECLKCHKRFTTYERVEETARLTVVKKDGSRVPFSRENVLRGVVVACGKLPIADEVKQKLVDDVEEDLFREFEREVPSSAIAVKVMARLRNLNDVAYVRFASAYYQFQSAGQMMQELSELSNRPKEVKDQAKLF